jgi:hypothetical protein
MGQVVMAPPRLRPLFKQQFSNRKLRSPDKKVHGLTPYEYIANAWTSQPSRFIRCRD